MYQASTSMPAVLSADQYVSAAASDRDQAILRERSWQLVATASMLDRVGDYVATERMGIPLMVRNHGGELTALRNVCAHRNCQLVDPGSGQAEELKCPYHGWRYGADGKTRKLPGAANFTKFDHDRYCLAKFPIKRVGELIFVYLGRANPDSCLEDFAEPDSILAAGTDPQQWQLAFHDRLFYPCDWKIVIEGSLESYHLSEVHADSFGHDPGEEASDHRLWQHGTLFATSVREPSFLATMEERSIRYLSGSFDPLYQHIHWFPGVMASMTDTLSLVYQIFPTGNQRCAMEVFGFTRTGTRGGVVARIIAGMIRRGAEKLARQVLAEDAAIFPKVQAGMVCAASDGGTPERIFGRCEERLDAFGRFWKTVCQSSEA